MNDVLELAFCVLALVLVYFAAVELFVAWYSGVDTAIPAAAFWLLVARIVVLCVAVLCVVAMRFVRVD